MLKTIIISILITLGTYNSFSQETVDEKFDKMKDKFEDVFAEEEYQMMTLRFTDAKTGDAVKNAEIILNNNQYITDFEGKIRFDKINKDGVYGFTFSCPGYISASYKFEVLANTIFNNRFSVSPVLEIGSMRFVLDWSRRPADLDAHFINQGTYHISYRNSRTFADGKASLDRDDRDGFGPETITVKDIDENASYKLFIQDYTYKDNPGSERLSKSGAVVRVYSENQLVKTIRIIENRKGTKWDVLKIDKGNIVVTNSISN